MMNKKTLILTAILGLLLVTCVVYLILPRSLKLVYVLDSDHLASIVPEGTFVNMTCPYDDSTLTRLVLIEEEGGADAPWRAAFICENENIFWIANYRGGVDKILWYGPFDASYDAANIIASVGAAISGVTLIAVIATHYTPSNSNQKTEKAQPSYRVIPPS